MRIAKVKAPSIGLPEFSESLTTPFQSRPRTTDAMNAAQTAVASFPSSSA